MFTFGEYTIDPERREVRRNGQSIPLEPRAFDVLEVLVRNRDRVVSKAELLDEIWGGPFVSESALTTCIKESRRALGDDGQRQAVLRNVRGRGYRFVAEVAVASSAPVGMFGREDDLSALLDRLAPGVVVTLVGPGGVGKTTLANAAGAACADRFPDGVWQVDLIALADDEEVPGAVARAARLDASPEDLHRRLAGLGAMLVLDNCEHLLAGVARLVDGLHSVPGSSIVVLATSRERLGVPSEQVFPILPLSPGPAAEMFAQRSAAATPAVDPGELDPTEVDRLLSALDHLPLAIEMAAARLSTMSLEDLASAVTGGLDVLRSPRRSGPQRHESLRSLVGWSTEQLSAHDSDVLEGLTVFAGPFTVGSAAAVVGSADADAASVQRALSNLAGSSLLQVDPGPPIGFHMLETVRVALLQGGARPRARLYAAHADWLVDLLGSADALLRGPDEPLGRRRIEEVGDELRASHRWARGHDHARAASLTRGLQLFAHTRLWAEPVAWSDELAELLSPGDPAHAHIDATRAAQAAHTGRLAEAERLAADALGSADARGDLLTCATALDVLCDVALFTGDLTAAANRGAQLLSVGLDLGDLHYVTMARLASVLALAYGGDHDAAAVALEALDGARADVPAEDLAPSDRAWRAYGRAEVTARDDPASAVAALREAIEMADSVGNRYAASVSRTSLLSQRSRTGDPAEALVDSVEILEDCRRHGNTAHATTLLRNLIELLVRVDAVAEAVRIHAALETAEKPTYGEELRRLEARMAGIRDEVDTSVFAAWQAEGHGRGTAWALERAIGAVAGAIG